ncbi:alpha/beta-hydrolase [Moniliophthora roreri MCA 2997]|uniref:Alpha/beta-hydrolase n=2 Tax=Moniliophthora roreri TaxID=221103 RepID=V2YH46_MONRO|nr:alpha/beta-hydrolase [Moniliophthora roreri MCA 2997]KAI3596960.1 alpha/beta-hydrolase [Moniliophthora roreri]
MFSSIQHFFLPGQPEEGGILFPFCRYIPNYCYPDGTGRRKKIALVFLHSVGTPAETWLPVIENICQLDVSSGKTPIIGELWLAELPTHGHGALVNEESLLHRPQGVSVAGWARGLQVLLGSNLISSKHVIGIGHSAGACSLSMSTIGVLHKVQYSSLILVDPPIQPTFDEIISRPFVPPEQLEQIRKAAKLRKDIWPSRESARAWLASRSPWKHWDPKVLDLHIEYGLRNLPTRTYPEKTEGVTLTLTREQESAGFLYPDEAIESMHWLARLGSKVPIHCIFAGKEINRTKFPVRKPTDKRSPIASISKVDDAGHLVVQEKPRELARTIWSVVCSMEFPTNFEMVQPQSKL